MLPEPTGAAAMKPVRGLSAPDVGRRLLPLMLSCGALALMAGCSSGQGYSARVLQHRLDRRLAVDVAAHRASIQNRPDGALVTLDEPALFDANKTNLNAAGVSTVTNVVEALLAPELMQVELNGSSQTPDDLRAGRVHAVRSYVEAYSLAMPIPMDALVQPAPPAAGQAMTIAIHVHCPPGPQGSTWTYQVDHPTCN